MYEITTTVELTGAEIYDLLLMTLDIQYETDDQKWRRLSNKLGKALNDDYRKTKKVKAAIFGVGCEVTDEMWRELKDYAEFIKQKHWNERRIHQ